MQQKCKKLLQHLVAADHQLSELTAADRMKSQSSLAIQET